MKEFFHNVDENQDSDNEDHGGIQTTYSIVKNKSSFVPHRGRNETLDNYINFISDYPKHTNTAAKYFNTSKSENVALKQLRSRDDIIIKEADKGGAFVIMPKDYYKDKIEQILADTSSYKETTQKAEESAIRKVKILTTKHKFELTDDERDYITNFESKTSNIYGLPKVHKSHTIMNTVQENSTICVWTPRPEDLPFRPIIAGPVCPTHRLSNVLDIVLKPMLTHIPSYLQDTIDFLKKLPSNVDTNSVLVTYDVINLYGSIPHSLGQEAITYWLNKHPNAINTRFSHDFILKSVKLILENNVFTFGPKYYVQTKGTAMGTKVGPTYATLVMGYLENKLYTQILEDKRPALTAKIQQNWKRFLDDCFIIWQEDDGDINYLTRTLNQLHPDIRFTVTLSKQSIPFLDVMVIKNGTTITTDVYSKPTDTKNYLLFSSCHPRHVKTGVPKTLATRLVTIINDESTLNKRLEELKKDLLGRGYPEQIITHGITLARSKNRDTLLQRHESNATKPKDQKESLPLVTTYNPKQFNLYNLVNNTINTLSNDERLRSLVPKLKLINSRRQGPNLKSLLTKAKFSENSSMMANNYSVNKCSDPKCGTCEVLLEGSSYKLKESGHTLTVNDDLTCKAQYVIYVIKCQGCHSDYIGSTKNLRHRVALHKSQIKCDYNRNCPVSGHLADCGRGKFKIFPFLKISSANDTYMRETEFKLIRNYKPLLNST